MWEFCQYHVQDTNWSSWATLQDRKRSNHSLRSGFSIALQHGTSLRNLHIHFLRLVSKFESRNDDGWSTRWTPVHSGTMMASKHRTGRETLRQWRQVVFGCGSCHSTCKSPRPEGIHRPGTATSFSEAPETLFCWEVLKYGRKVTQGYLFNRRPLEPSSLRTFSLPQNVSYLVIVRFADKRKIICIHSQFMLAY